MEGEFIRLREQATKGSTGLCEIFGKSPRRADNLRRHRSGRAPCGGDILEIKITLRDYGGLVRHKEQFLNLGIFSNLGLQNIATCHL